VPADTPCDLACLKQVRLWRSQEAKEVGVAAAALTAGIIRDSFGTYTYAWFGGAVLCALAAVLSIGLRRHRDVLPTTAGTGTRDTDFEAEISADLTP
jgi:hypothetical protein